MDVEIAATVLVPTHTHAETLRHSVPTALGQTVGNIEVFIVGDGVPDAVRTIVAELVASDRRVRFFDFPKGPSRDELHRHRVLQKARGQIVCYLFDDDLWLPDHIAVMRELLQDADFAFSTPVVVEPDGELSPAFVDLQRPLHKRLFTDSRSGTVSVPTCAAHTMALYRRLPYGWRTTPRGLAPDKYMWAQCLANAVARSTSRPTALVFPDPPRRSWTSAKRVEELREWSRRLHDPQWQRQLFLDVISARARQPDRRPGVMWLYALSLRIPFAGGAMRSIGKWLFAPKRRKG